jgi:hypothetical protein
MRERSAAQRDILIRWTDVHPSIVTDHKSLKEALILMKARICGNQPAARLENFRGQHQHIGSKVIIQMMKDSDCSGYIGWRQAIFREISKVVTNEFAAGAMRAFRPRYIGGVAVEADISSFDRQTMQ